MPPSVISAKTWITLSRPPLPKPPIEGLRDILNGPRYKKAVADLAARGEQATSSAIYAQMLANGNGNAQGKIAPACIGRPADGVANQSTG